MISVANPLPGKGHIAQRPPVAREEFVIRSSGNWFPLPEMRNLFWVAISGRPWDYLWADGQVHVGTGTGVGDGWFRTVDDARRAIEAYCQSPAEVAPAAFLFFRPHDDEPAEKCDDLSLSSDSASDDGMDQCTGRHLRDAVGDPLSAGLYTLSGPGCVPQRVTLFEDDLNCDLWLQLRVPGRVDLVNQRVEELSPLVVLTRVA